MRGMRCEESLPGCSWVYVQEARANANKCKCDLERSGSDEDAKQEREQTISCKGGMAVNNERVFGRVQIGGRSAFWSPGSPACMILNCTSSFATQGPLLN